jgi:hypothetical protein
VILSSSKLRCFRIIIINNYIANLTIPNLEIFLFCQHNATGGGNLELEQTITFREIFFVKVRSV